MSKSLDVDCITSSEHACKEAEKYLDRCFDSESEGNNEMRESIARAQEIVDSGKHYRWKYKGLKLDAYRIADIVGLKDNALFSALKKILAAGERGGKDYVQDIIEARDALNRKLEMIEEDLE